MTNASINRSSTLAYQGFLTEHNCNISINVNKSSINELYDVSTRPFARGKFAQVRRCVRKDTNKQYAAKTIKKRRRAADVTHEIMHEIRVLFTVIENERIVRLYEIYETPTEFILMLEMAEGGELQRVLDEEDSIPEQHCRRIMRQIIEGVQFLHRYNIAHLDIKPQNILLTKCFPDGDVKLCDFGISRILTKGAEIREIVGTPDYVAPEILQFEPISLSTDMWSIGILAYVLLSGHSPFTGETKQETYCNITNGPLEFPTYLFGSVSEMAKDFIQKLLIRDPKKRMNCQECLNHEWLSLEYNDRIIVLNAPTILMNGQKVKKGDESDSDKENQSKHSLLNNMCHNNGINDEMTATNVKHKRLSSDTFPDRKVVAVVPKEAHVVDDIPITSAKLMSCISDKFYSPEKDNLIKITSRKSPPTPSKKFFLSVETSRSRSVSLDRNTTKTSVSSIMTSSSSSSAASSSGDAVDHSVVMQFESLSFSQKRSYLLSEEITVDERVGYVY